MDLILIIVLLAILIIADIQIIELNKTIKEMVGAKPLNKSPQKNK